MNTTTTTSSQPIYGNYHGYYTKRSQFATGDPDPRLAHLHPDTFKGKRVLDIGCNEGWVTCEIAQSWGAASVLGVDIDDTLIRAAWKRRRTLWSLMHSSDSPQNAQNGHYDLDSNCQAGSVVDYFPASCIHTHGPLPIPASSSEVERDVFPHNVAFRTEDWTQASTDIKSDQYDVVLALSVTKWIHLHNGDEGIRRFFQRVYDVLAPGGIFILEAQAWDGYAKAKRMDPTLKENYKHLVLRPERDFETILQETGFTRQKRFQGNDGEGFQRPVDIYIK